MAYRSSIMARVPPRGRSVHAAQTRIRADAEYTYRRFLRCSHASMRKLTQVP